MTPDFDDFIKSVTPNDDGFFFDPKNSFGQSYKDVKELGRVISAIGESARIVAKRDNEGEVAKFATAHDLRRSFAARWAPRVKPYFLQHLMRHSDIKTTLQFYAGDMLEMASSEVWDPEISTLESEFLSLRD